MATLFIYVVDRDFGFAPNPFHGVCTLATCKPILRKSAQIGDWVIGMGGARLDATGRCIFAMEVTRKIGFDEYWARPEFRIRRPVRNGSMAMIVGDNIYCHNAETNEWLQADSHHSHPDGSANTANVAQDTSADAVLISQRFIYFGNKAPKVPGHIITKLGYSNGRGYRVFNLDREGAEILEWILTEHRHHLNRVVGDPFDFANSSARYSAATNKVTI